MSKSGVQEWAQHSINLQYTCEYGCRYCYARKLNNRFKFQPKEPVIKKYNGVVMFPTMHDITISNFNKVADTIEKLLKFDNKILIVSKMSLNIAHLFVDKFKDNKFKNNLEFRISITHSGIHEKLCIPYHFEIKSPKISERIDSLRLLLNVFKCSVSVEPLLDLIVLKDFIEARFKYGNNSINIENIWIGCLTNYKLNPKIRAEELVIELYKTLPEIYEEYKQYDFIKWKDSFLKAMNREIKRRKNGGLK